MEKEPNLSAGPTELAHRAIEAMKKKEPDSAELKNVLGQVKDDSAFFDAMKKNLGGLDVKVRAEISANLKKLDSAVMTTVSGHLEKMNMVVEEGLGAQSEGEKNGFLEQASKTVEEYWKYAQEHPGEVIGKGLLYGTGAVAAIYVAKKLFDFGSWLVGRGKSAGAQAKDAAQQTDGGWFTKTLVYTGIGIGAFFGIKWMVDYIQKNYTVGGVMKAATDGAKEMFDRVTALEFGAAPWKKYGLENKTEYEEAQKIAREKRRQPDMEDAVRKAFHLEPGETSPGFEKFMADQVEGHEVRVLNDITYVRPTVAFYNYEQNVEAALLQLKEMVIKYKGEIQIGTYLAYRIGILDKILSSGLSAAKMATEVGVAMAKWGIKHPFITFFGASGALLGAGVASQALDVYVPEDFEAMAKASLSGKPLMLTSTKGGEFLRSVMTTFASGLTTMDSGFREWVSEQLGNLWHFVSEDVPNLIALSPEELVAGRHMECLDAMRDRLILDRKYANGKELTRSTMLPKYDRALKALEAFHISHLRERCMETTQSDEPVRKFAELNAALADSALGITVVNNGGIYTWKEEGMDQAWDICVDPSNTDKKSILSLSRQLQHGESDWTLLLSTITERVREEQQKNIDKMPKLPGGTWVGMVVGNFVYFTDLGVAGKTLDYCIMVPYNIVAGLFQDKSWGEWRANVANGMITTSLFAVNAAWIAQIKRFAVGGGPLIQSRTGRVLMSVTPIVSQGNFLMNIVRSIEDFKNLRRFGYWDGKLVNTVCSRSRLRPHWLMMVESHDPVQMQKAASWMGMKIKGLKDMTPDNMYRNIRRQIIDERFNHVHIRRLKDIWANIKAGNLFGAASEIVNKEEVTFGEDLYEMIVDTFKNGTKSGSVGGGGALDPLATAAEQNLAALVSAAAAEADDATRLAKYAEMLADGASTDDLLRFGATFEDLTEALSTLDPFHPELAWRMSGLPQAGDALGDISALLNDSDEFTRAFRCRELLKRGFAAADLLNQGAYIDDLLTAGVNPGNLINAALAIPDDIVRQACMAELLATQHADDLLKAAGGTHADDFATLAYAGDLSPAIQVKVTQAMPALRQQVFGNRLNGLVQRAAEIEAMNGAARVQAWEKFFADEVRPFMGEFNEFAEGATDARRALAAQVLGAPLTDRQWQALELAHEIPDPMKKFRALMGGIENYDSLSHEEQLEAVRKMKRLMQVGLAGELPADTIDEAAKAGAVIGTATDAVNSAKDVAKVTGASDALLDGKMWEQAVKQFGKGVTIANVSEFLDAADKAGALKINPDTLALIKQSPKAQEILVGAAKVAGDAQDFTEVTRALKAAQVARNWRIGFNAVGAVGDAFGFMMAMADLHENGLKIEQANQTRNEALADVYRQMRLVNAAEMAQSGGSFAIGTGIMIHAYWSGQSFLTAISASGSLLLLPAAVATIGGGYMSRRATEVSETWLRTSADWVQVLSPGEILEKLDALGPGQHGYWQGWGKGTIAEQMIRQGMVTHGITSMKDYVEWEKKGDETVEAANSGSRYELTKAYVIQTSPLVCQPQPVEDVDTYRSRFDQFVIDQMLFLGVMTQGTYSRLLGEGYVNARKHAELMAESRKLKKEKRSRNLEWRDGEGKTRKFDIADYEDTSWAGDRNTPSQMSLIGRYLDEQRTVTVLQFVMMKNMAPDMSPTERKVAIKQQLILAIQDEFNKLNGHLESADFAGIMGWDSEGKGAARLAAVEMIGEELEKQSAALLAKIGTKEGLGVGDYTAAVERLKQVCGERDAIKLQKIASERGVVREGRMTDAEKPKQELTAGELLKKAAQETKDEQYAADLKEMKSKLSEKDLTAMRKELGQLHMMKNGIAIVNYQGRDEYGQVQFGQIFNKYLYIKFIKGKWMVSLGNYGNGPWSDPESFRVNVGYEATSGRYNKVIADFDHINKESAR